MIIIEREKKDKYLDLARELKKLWNMKVTFIPIIIGALVRVTKGLIKGLKDLEIRDHPNYCIIDRLRLLFVQFNCIAYYLTIQIKGKRESQLLRINV